MLEKKIYLNALYDFYHPLLTDKQKKYMDLYYTDDFSLGEIAENYGVSRQAIYDNLKRTETLLDDFEKHLHLYEKYNKRSELLEQLRHLLEDQDFSKEKALGLIELIENLD
ncbi:putative DNA-binding protein YlxM (UPF0122 family) [Pullulanibacillus pueri]|uniref:UPF0122 protein GCM10007096_03530 n=1 Tax=Pullulanibacillus pueri TaxID=1437324 RepID=A0A8J2ZSI2_9BACL|nr:putative DNA-binding protein [Pullulanibacillus pueri]MBM7680204.1 putative DNA-binding protein YlxM (UPF0122 family) [Pullulanibacillus pueri]GGH74880.1 UPF0122 protein [Pullulanibacillus pueri]